MEKDVFEKLIDELEEENRKVDFKIQMLHSEMLELFQMGESEKLEHYLMGEQFIALQNYKKYLKLRIDLYKMKEGKNAN